MVERSTAFQTSRPYPFVWLSNQTLHPSDIFVSAEITQAEGIDFLFEEENL